MTLIDFASPDFWADPYASYRRLREEAPVYWSEQIQSWIVSRHADVFPALSDPRLSVAYTDWFFLGLPEDLLRRFEPFRRALRTTIVFADPPQHDRMRGLMHKGFNPKFIESFRQHAIRLVDELLAQAVVDGKVDVRNRFATLLPATALTEQIGADRPDVAQFASWGRRLLYFFGRLPNDIQLAEDTLAMYGEMTTYFRQLFERRRNDPHDTLLKSLLHPARPEDELTEDELIMTCMGFLVGGIETVSNLVCNMLVTFDRHPEELARLRRDPSLVPSAVEEVLRYESPVQVTFRLVKEEMDIGGQRLVPGQRVMLGLASANRDPAAFPDPDRFDIGRQENRHVGFGYGRHFCTGAQLGRFQGQAVMRAFYLRYPEVRVLEQPVEWETNLVHRGPKALSVALG